MESEKYRYGYKNKNLCAEDYGELVQNGTEEKEVIE